MNDSKFSPVGGADSAAGRRGLNEETTPRLRRTPPEEGNVPRLRFVEFLGAGEWEEKKLNQLGVLISGLTYSPDDVRDEGLLVLRSSNVQNGIICLENNVYVVNGIKGANLSEPNDILICVRNGSKNLIGKNALIPEGMPLCTHGAFMTVFRSPFAKFIFQLFQTDVYQQHVDGDLGATINSINGTQFLKYAFHVPSEPEQQKIADCLSSIDDVISAESQKLTALKDHKKGLMQGLFPSSGGVDSAAGRGGCLVEETTPPLRGTPPKEGNVPRLRFPEFLGAGEWCNKIFEKLYSFKVTNSFSRENLNYEQGLVKNIH